MSQPSPRLLWHRFSNSALVRFLLLFACGWAIVELLAYFEIVVVIFTCATILAFLLSYPVRWLNRFLPRGFAVFLVFAISFMVLGGLVVTLGLTLLSQGQRLAENLTVFLSVGFIFYNQAILLPIKIVVGVVLLSVWGFVVTRNSHL